ncbi:MAG: CBS domain-containing protein [Lactobacillales bacterium]|jgi:acetoin utilization protein AcuB|nr:CBS domain-containing protein [Lactobacillales bacterium]
MAIKDFMTAEVISVSPETKISRASEVMKEHDIHRVPVMDGNKLVGLITEGTIQEASPSKATSLSVYEMNYLLNKTTVADVMIKDVLTISPDALLEDGIYLMRSKNVGVLPVLDGEKLVGIITDKDIFDAFLKITGYGKEGVRASLEITEDHPGVLADITRILAEKSLNILTIVVAPAKLKTVIEIQLLSTDEETVKEILTSAGYKVTSVVKTDGKDI